MTISFYSYVKTDTGFDFPPGVQGRLSATLMPHHEYRSPEYMAWYNSDEPDPENPNYDSRLDINLANHNAADLLNELGYDMDDEPVALFAFIERLSEISTRFVQDDPALERYESSEKGKLCLIYSGRQAGYLRNCLNRLGLLADAAIEYGATHIGWG